MARDTSKKRKNPWVILAFTLAFNLVHQIQTSLTIITNPRMDDKDLNTEHTIPSELMPLNNLQNRYDIVNGTEPLQNSPEILPIWMTDYVAWHQQQRQAWNASHWRSRRYLIMTCQQGQKCGGTADRLRPSLTLLRLAAQTHRIFLIHWEHPAPLETFLMPPQGGLDWRVPDWLLPKLKGRSPAPNFPGIRGLAEGKNVLVPTQYQSTNYGAHYYNENITSSSSGEKRMDDILADFWKLLFTPAPGVAISIQEQLDRLQLVPGKYVGIHLRAYTIEPNQPANKNQSGLQRDAENALNCGRKLQPAGGPYFFASDSPNATRMAVEYGSGKGAKVRTISSQQDPIHLGFVRNANTTALANVFVDLYLLSLGRCVTYGSGGFGQLAYLLNGNRCGFRHGKRGRKCSWTSMDTRLPNTEPSQNSSRPVPTRLFLPPMSDVSK